LLNDIGEQRTMRTFELLPSLGGTNE